MGNYNPHAPYILGNEWVPIRQANWQPDEITERGYEFSIDHAAIPVTGAFYVAEVPQTRTNQTIDLISVYPAGTETLSGPVKVVNIPVSAVWTTGASIANATVANLLNPSDGSSVRFTAPSDSFSWLGLSFDIPAYSQQLYGKRILDVKFLYSLSGGPDASEDISLEYGFAKGAFGFPQRFNLFEPLETSPTGAINFVADISLTSINPFWDTTRDPYLVHDVYPWRYQELARFAATEPAASRMTIMLFNGLSGSDNAFLYFAGMQITYCEENRVVYGGTKTESLQGVPSLNAYEVGPNLTRLRNSSALAYASTSLPAGAYVTTLVHAQLPIDSNRGIPTLAGIRELYELPHQRGLLLHQTLTPDAEFTETDIDMLPEITLHTATAIITGTHPYGVQDKIPVYGSITAIQEIEDDPAGTSKQYPQVRFYARRFGNTSVALTLVDVATGTFTTSITVEDFDALPEIVDGWKEVTLRFASPPSFATAAGDVDWRWQATGEAAGNQWQVLGAGSRTFAAHSIGPASYYAPQGDTVTLTWQSPAISGTADDTLSDATLIFSTDAPTVSGFAVETATQEVSVASGCIVPPRCLPTGIYYQELSWTLPDGIACDTFERTEVAAWGDADTGQTWTLNATASQWNVADGEGTIQPSLNSNDRFSTITTNTVDNSVTTIFGVSALPATGSLITGVVIRYVDSSNHYIARASIATTGVVTAMLTKRVAGVMTTISSFVMPLIVVAGERYKIRAQAVGTALAVKIWPVWQEEPSSWTITGTDSSITTGTMVGLYARNESAVVTQIFSYDDFSAVPFQLLDGRYEIQRSDDYGDWQTIADTTDLCITGFNDYEARVGVQSDYRIRLCNALDFCGPTWATASNTLTAPGVVVSGDGNSVLIFTSNQAPDSNLAYVMQWEGQPVETFAFPEADEVQLKRMFGKDFFTAFHPLERGGEQFTRTLLVNAAAITLPSLANFRSLRDLAWQTLDYVCVRDELGNRWFANIRVPDGNVRMDRTIYLAQVSVTEVTDTPTPVGA